MLLFISLTLVANQGAWAATTKKVGRTTPSNVVNTILSGKEIGRAHV